MDSESNYRKWDVFKNCDLNTLRSIEHVQKKPKIDIAPEEEQPVEEDDDENAPDVDNDEDVCMVCLDREPNTMVLPCEHCVVCKECSIGLRNTNDKKTCVRCRRPITHVLE